MHTEHDALPVVADNGASSLFVAATLAALVLAGSALVYRKTFEQQPEREKLTHPSEQPTPDDMDTEKNQPLDVHRYAEDVSSTHDPDSKESKSSRSKDRRRRGKDPLKENVKGGKKVKSTSTMPVKQLFTGDDLDNLNNIPSPSTPASSSTRNSTPNSLSRGSGKRTQQPDDSLYNLTEAPVGTMHSRPTSEVSQSNTGSKIPDQPHPPQHTRDRTASFTSVSDHHVSPSSSSSHNGTEDNTSFLDERNLIRQTRETPIFSTIIPNNDFVNHSLPSSASSATTSCVITPATSPSLSYTSSKLAPHVAADSEFAPNNGSRGSDCGPKNNPVSADPSHALGADTKTRKQQLSPNPTPSKSKSKSTTKAQNTWEWDNTGEVPPSSSSISVSASVKASAPTSSLITAPAFPPDIVYRKPPRLQPKSLWSKNAKNDASSSIPGSVSHPSLLSPTSGSFASSDSALLSPSISSSLEKVSSRVSKAAKEGEGGESEEERDTTDDSYTQLEFPTLNPTTMTTLASNGGSTASSSAAGPSNNHRPTTPRRAHSSRGPPTPSGSTPPPHSGSGSAQPPSTPAVSTQTQLASLRGALEAARLREEKHKAEMERYSKELETLRWENMNSRRGEVELQNHIRHLMHQLQMYSSLFASVTPQPTSQQQPPQQTQGLMAGSAGLSNPGERATSGPEPGNGPTTSSPGPQHVQSPTPPTAAVFPGPPVSSPRMHLHTLPPLQLNALPSPSSMHAPSPYFPYPMPPPPLHPHSVMSSPHPLFAQQFQQQFLQFQQYQPHIQNQSQSPTIQAQQGNPLSMLHHPSLTNISSYQSYIASSSSSLASGSRSSSRPGTESTGSSPDLNGSLSPGSGSKRKVRTRTQTANGYVGGRAVRKDSWIVGGVGIDEGDEDEGIHEDEEQRENGDEDEGGFNEILADAILKRPDSIGVRSGKKHKQALLEKEMEEGKMNKDRELEQLEDNILDAVEPLTEFKFPSLSDFGNVYDRGHNRSSSSSSVIVSEDLGSNIYELPALASQDIVHFEAVVSRNGVELDNRNDNQPISKTTSSSSESERTPRREESEPNITEPLMNFNEAVEEATNVPEGG